MICSVFSSKLTWSIRIVLTNLFKKSTLFTQILLKFSENLRILKFTLLENDRIIFPVQSVEHVRLLFVLDQMQHNYENSSISDFLLVYKSLSAPFSRDVVHIGMDDQLFFLSAIV